MTPDVTTTPEALVEAALRDIESGTPNEEFWAGWDDAAAFARALTASPALRDAIALGVAWAAVEALRAAAQAYIDWRDERLAQWKAVEMCGHADPFCPEMLVIRDTPMEKDDQMDEAIRQALSALHAALQAREEGSR